MKKFVCFLLFIFCYQVGISQVSNAKILYKVSFGEKTESPSLKGVYEIVRKSIIDANFQLLCSSNKSFYGLVKTMNSDYKDDILFAATIIGSKGEYYTDLKEDIVLEKIEAYGKEFVIKHMPSEIDWKMHNETKEIGGFTCYKATTTFTVNNSTGKEFVFPVVAWYTPETNLPFGPKKYSGLPGLILELTEKEGTVFTVSNIEYDSLSEDELNLIKKPESKKVLTKKEFEKVGIKIAKENYSH